MALIQRNARIDDLTGRQKAAIVCMVLGADAAARIQQELSPEESEMIAAEVARMGQIEPSLAEAVLHEWLELLQAADSLAQGGLDYAREILVKAYGQQRGDQMFNRIKSHLSETAGLHLLRNADPTQLASMLRNEHPQTIALILAHLQPGHTANVLKEIDAGLGGEVVFRMAKMEKVAPEMLALIERAIVTDDLGPSTGLSSSGGPHAVASILNVIPSTLEKELLNGVAGRDPALAEQIRGLMFVFNDLIDLDDAAIKRLLKEVQTEELALALKGAHPDLSVKIMASMTQRGKDALAENIELLGPKKKREIEAAQAAVVQAVRRLEEAGEIQLGRSDEEIVA